MSRKPDIVERLLRFTGNNTDWPTISEAAAEIERLIAERDEARREVSYLRPSVCLGAQTANEYARERGWDCFKENNQ